MQQIIIILAVIAAVVFFITNHFKKQRIDKRIFIPSVIFIIISIVNFNQYKSLHTVVIGLFLRIIVGILIGILQGYLAKLTVEGQEVFTEGTVIGMAFWLIFIPVRLFVLPWLQLIAPGGVNLNSSENLGISALYIFIGFFVAKACTLIFRKNQQLS
jgi:hypothetical protein